MEPSLYAQWASQPQLLQGDSSNHHQSSSSSSIVDDWTKDRSSATAVPTTGGVGSPLASGGGLDLSDFGLGDLGSTSSSSSLVSPTSSYFTPYQQQSSYFMGSYGATPYGNLWPNQSVPLSNYSTLNGATTSSTTHASSSSANSATNTQSQTHSSPPVQHAQTHQPQSHGHSSPPLKSAHTSNAQASTSSSNSQPMMIDPALTTLNGSGSRNMQSYPSSSYSPPVAPQQQQQQLSNHELQQLLSTMYGSRQYYYPQQQQQHQQSPQGTLSPQALHSPASSMMQTILPSSFYTNSSSPPIPSSSQVPSQPVQPPAPPPEPKLSLEERTRNLMASIKSLLNAKNFTGAGAVNNLAEKIADFPASDVPAASRLEILTKIRDGAGNHYFRAWSENATAMDITRDWLKAAFVAEDESPLAETTMPLLHIIDRLPMTLDTLKASKLGKLVVKLVKDPPTPAVKDMASNIERRWRDLVTKGESASKGSESEDLKSKKRKLNESSLPAKGQAAPPAKKPAIGTTTASKPLTVKKESASTSKAGAAPAVKDAKSDSSFFSAPKPKPRLPSFKKAPPAPVPTKAAATAQPSAEDPFQEALKLMASRRKESPAVSTPPSTTTANSTTSQPQLTKSSKKRKTVSWAPEDKLVAVRHIEKAIYDDDPKDGVHVAHSIRELDRSEGAALHAHMFEEALDWSEPISIDFTGQEERPQRGESSEEKFRQEQREATALGAVYMSAAQIPDSPAEPAHVISEEETDKNVTTMVCGTDADAVFWSGPPMTGQQSVADLVGQLASGNMAVDPAVNNTPFNSSGLDLGAVGLQQAPSLSAITSLPQEQLQQLLQQLTANATQGGLSNLFGLGGGEQQPQAPYGNSADQPGGTWGATNNYGSMDYTMGSSYHDDSDSRGGYRGRGRGRGRGGREGGFKSGRTRPCSFFQQGRRASESTTRTSGLS